MRRLDELKKRLERATQRKERDVAKRYATLYRELRELVGDYYERYERNGVLTLEEMAKFQRLEKLMAEVDEIINNSETGLRNEIRSYLREHYKESYYQTAFILETSAKAKIGYTTLKDEVIDAAINNRFTGLTLNERLSRRRMELIYSMRESIVRGLAEGQTYRGIANVIKDQLEGDLAKAQRIVRTESRRIREEASFESAIYASKKGIIMTKTWRCVSDERSRDDHIKMDGITIPIDEQFELNGRKADYPLDPNLLAKDVINCRCRLSKDIVGVERPQHEDMVDLTYAEWRKERLS